MSSLTTSATRRSRSVPAAVLIASAAASSHEVLLVPMISVTLYTLITISFDHPRPASGLLRPACHTVPSPVADDGSGRLSHVRVAVVGRRDELFLDGPGVDPADQVEDRARLVVGAAGPGPAERLLADDRAGRLVVDVEVARREPQGVGGLRDRGPVLRDDRTGERVRRDVRRLGHHVGVLRVLEDVHAQDGAEVL